MKRKFNLYCILLLIAIAFGFSVDIYNEAGNILQSWKDGGIAANNEYDVEKGKAKEVEAKIPDYVNLETDNPDRFLTAIKNKTSGQMDSIQVMGYVRIIRSPIPNGGIPFLLGFAKFFVTVLFIVSAIGLWIVFIRLILAVNSGVTFDIDTERKLKLMGIFALLLYVSEWGIYWCDYIADCYKYNLDGYHVAFGEVPSAFILYLGIGLQIIAQMFAIARKMKEEQELTI